jgi:hypothetical protein
MTNTTKPRAKPGRKPRGGSAPPLQVRRTAEERARWDARARAEGLDVSALARRLLDDVPLNDAERAELIELRRLAADLRARLDSGT